MIVCQRTTCVHPKEAHTRKTGEIRSTRTKRGKTVEHVDVVYGCSRCDCSFFCRFTLDRVSVSPDRREFGRYDNDPPDVVARHHRVIPPPTETEHWHVCNRCYSGRKCDVSPCRPHEHVLNCPTECLTKPVEATA